MTTDTPATPDAGSAARSIAALEARVASLEEAMTSLAGSIDHDLRAPLRIASAYIAILETDHAPALDTEARRLFDVVTRQLHEMDRLLSALLALSEAGTMPLVLQQADMQRMAGEAAAMADGEGRTTTTIGSLDDAPCDRIMLSRVWRHLLDNAVKFTATVPHPAIAVSSSIEDGMAVYAVNDNGVGFDPERTALLFRPFSRLHGREFDGVGMGLAIVRRLVERHGGQVRVDCAPDGGTTFRFSLPLARLSA